MQDFDEQTSGLLLDSAIPGEGLTTNPDSPSKWETPPDYVRVEEFMDDLVMNITKEDNLDGVLDPIRKGIPIEDVAQMLLFQAFTDGKITPDLMLGSIEPTITTLIGLAEYAGIPDPVLYPEDDMLDDEDDLVSALEQEGGIKPEAPTVAKGLLARAKEVAKDGT